MAVDVVVGATYESARDWLLAHRDEMRPDTRLISASAPAQALGRLRVGRIHETTDAWRGQHYHDVITALERASLATAKPLT